MFVLVMSTRDADSVGECSEMSLDGVMVCTGDKRDGDRSLAVLICLAIAAGRLLTLFSSCSCCCGCRCKGMRGDVVFWGAKLRSSGVIGVMGVTGVSGIFGKGDAKPSLNMPSSALDLELYV